MALEESEALNHIEALQEHENDEIYKAAYDFISKYFSGGVSENETFFFNSEKRLSVFYVYRTMIKVM